MRFEPGPGMGGHCLPVDPFYLAYKAREHDFYTEFVELAGKINQAQPEFCVERIARALNDVAKPVRGSNVLLLGVAYKAGVGGPPRVAGAADDPAPARAGRRRRLPRPPHSRARPSSASPRRPLTDALRESDLACIVTAHDEVDYRSVVEEAPLVLDLRGVTRGIEAANLVRL